MISSTLVLATCRHLLIFSHKKAVLVKSALAVVPKDQFIGPADICLVSKMGSRLRVAGGAARLDVWMSGRGDTLKILS
jgi:hypothetical protein